MKPKPLHLLVAAIVVSSATSFGTVAHATTHDAASAAAAAAAAPLSEGEVRKVDKEAGKLTLRHGPIKSLDMPGMTMVFKVADPKLLDAVKQGDKVRFAAERVDGAITVIAIEAVR